MPRWTQMVQVALCSYETEKAINGLEQREKIRVRLPLREQKDKNRSWRPRFGTSGEHSDPNGSPSLI